MYSYAKGRVIYFIESIQKTKNTKGLNQRFPSVCSPIMHKPANPIRILSLRIMLRPHLIEGIKSYTTIKL